MIDFRNKLFIIACVPLFLMITSCGGNKPKESEIRAALAQQIPAFVEVTSFTIEALQNYGNEVEPRYHSRFRATVEASDHLYKLENKENDVLFLRLQTPKGNKIDIFGKTSSTLYQGAWQHSIETDGNPISNLGIPLNHFTGGHVIIRGSDEEKSYYAEVERKNKEMLAEAERKKKEMVAEAERKEAELRKNIANAKAILTGSWRDNNSLITYNVDGTGEYRGDDGQKGITAWEVDGDILIEKILKSIKKGSNEWSPSTTINKYKIIHIDMNSMVTKALKTGVTYNSYRIK